MKTRAHRRHRLSSLVALGLLAAVVGLVHCNDEPDFDDPGADDGTQAPDDEDYDPNWDLRPDAVATDPGGEVAETQEPLVPGPELTSDLDAAATALLSPPRRTGRDLREDERISPRIPYVQGTSTRYRITLLTKVQDRASLATNAQRLIHEALVVVSQVKPKGGARVRLTRESLRMQVLFGDAGGFDFDSRSPDVRLLERPELAGAIKPDLALMDVPAEFKITAGNAVEAVEGADRWREIFLDELDKIDPRMVAEASHAPEAQLLGEEWSWYLFPPLGAEPLGPKDSREVNLLRDTFSRGWVVSSFAVRATQIDEERDVLRVEGIATPSWRPRQGPARSNAEASIEMGRVAASADSSHAVWEIDRKRGILLRAWYAEEHRVDISYVKSRDPVTGKEYDPRFLKYERRILVEPVE